MYLSRLLDNILWPYLSGLLEKLFPTKSDQHFTVNCLEFWRHEYDPSTADLQDKFPDYTPWSQDKWLTHYNMNREGTTPQDDALFALRKLGPVTTSYKLRPTQVTQLQSLALDPTITDWTEYCSVLDPRQLEYVGW